MSITLPEGAVDAVTQEIIEGKLLAIVDEMGLVLARCSMSPVVYEVLDFACGICSMAGDLIAQTNGITLFTGTFGTQVRALHEKYRSTLAPGDIFVTNDPYRGGTHGCDMAVVRPVFDGDVAIAYAITVAHWLDVGGAVPGSLPANADSVFQEGLRLPGVRIARDDRLVEDVVAILCENVRMPELALGDLNAQIAAVRIADSRLLEICRRYGRGVLDRVCDRMLHVSESLARSVVRSLPDGRYCASDFIDGDGRSPDRILVQVAITIDGDTMTFDYTGSAPARAAPINCSRGALHSAAKTVFKALVAPDAPANDGWFRVLRVVAPEGTVFTAEKPSPTGWYYEGSAQASELAWKALAPLAPERFSAGSYMSLCATYLCGELPDGGGPFVHIEPLHGGWGATADRDGTGALIAVTDGDTFNYPAELLEARFPIRVLRHGLNTEGGAGAGRQRGGLGVVREYEILAEGMSLYASYGRTETAPWGVDGGREGALNYLEVVGADGHAVRLTRVAHHPLRRGDRVRMVTGGGGGWGPAEERARDAIEADLRNGYIDPGRALRDYGFAPQAVVAADRP